eukprot:COSAG01_NODE_778_length_13681_cov_15.265130_8_plen_96_part_00
MVEARDLQSRLQGPSSFRAPALPPCLRPSDSMGEIVGDSQSPAILVLLIVVQNIGLATAIAVSTFDEEDAARAAGIPVFYGEPTRDINELMSMDD